METTDLNQLVSDVSRDVLDQVAPGELPLLRAASQAYFRDPAKALSTKGEADDLLGFGVGEAATLFTPYVLAIMSEVVRFLVAEIRKSTKEESAKLIGEAVKSLFKRTQTSGAKTPPLTQEQLARVREIAAQEARRLKLSHKNEQLLADAITGSLAIAS